MRAARGILKRMKRQVLARAWLAAIAGFLLLLPASRAAAAVLTGEYFLHDPSRILKCNGKYFVYGTGDKAPMRFSTGLATWQAGPNALPSVPAWARQAVPAATNEWVWAPDVIFRNRQYWFYCSYSTFGSPISAIGLATSPTLDIDPGAGDGREGRLVDELRLVAA
jgi:arabinan endo-1,5-alpha-L-arabinosidase